MKKKKLWLLIVCILNIVVLLELHILKMFSHIEVYLNGNKYETLEVNNDYQDRSITVKKGKKVLNDNKYKLDIDNNLDKNKLGTYHIEYTITYYTKVYKLERIIEVVDNEKPVMTTNKEEITRDYCTKKPLEEITYTAYDNYDGDISNNVEVIEENDILKLTVSDTSGNTATKEITISYTDKPKDIFKLNGKTRLYVPINTEYKEEGVTYTDGCGNTLNDKINTDGNVDTNTIGEYKLTYSVDGNSLVRTIYVYEPKTYSGSKVIYLTFDDGPGYYTKSILDTLDKYNVKATFFVTNQFPDYKYMIKEEYARGHKVGVHTYSHKYDIYTSLESYLDDFNKINEVIREETGEYSKIFRFPGGSSNTVSRNYKYGIMRELSLYMTNEGYVYFDWNVSSNDAAGANSNTIYNKVVSNVASCSECVVLMHDIKGTTANALDNILSNLTSKGYTFATLSETSPTVHHSLNN